MDYVLWEASTMVRNACVLGGLQGFDDVYDLKSGVSFADSFPSGAEFPMSPDFPNNMLLTDNVMNEEGLLVGSGRLRRFLESRGTRLLEYLPVAIRNHKDKIASKDYFVLNPIRAIECLNEELSGAERDLILPDEIDLVRKLVLDVEKIDIDREIFRIARFPKVTVVHRKLADLIDKENFTGIRWLELSNYPEI